eukprot:3856895-Alexandrium_andersonii.AAC.1
MSASLVGSEMCIRDRASATREMVRDELEVSVLHDAKKPPLELPASAPTVSYTHLTLPTICSV